MFYFDKEDERVLFQDVRKVEKTLCYGRHFEVKPDIQADFTNMPYPDESFAMVVFDPPHLLRNVSKSTFADIYGSPNLQGVSIRLPDDKVWFPWQCGLTAMACSGLLLTPVGTDGFRSGMTLQALKNHGKAKANLAEQIARKVGGGTSRLNPLYVGEMMGYPSEWLTLPFLSQNGDEKVSKR